MSLGGWRRPPRGCSGIMTGGRRGSDPRAPGFAKIVAEMAAKAPPMCQEKCVVQMPLAYVEHARFFQVISA